MEVARKQYESLIGGLRAIGEERGWEIEQLVFVGGTCGSVSVESFNKNLKRLEVPEGRWNRLRQRMAKHKTRC
jgi:hypothetical protein